MSKSRLLLIFAAIALVVALSSCVAPNRPPIAAFTRSPTTGDIPLSVYFDARESLDPDGLIVSYAWDFGDGTDGAGLSVSHTYERAGAFEATLTVVDDRGAKDSMIRAIVVSDPIAPPETGTQVGQLAPGFTLRSFDGVETSLKQFRGYVVLLDFWRSSCPPCRLTMPHLESLREQFADAGLVVVAVNLDASEAEARAFLDENGFDEFIALRGDLSEATAVRWLYGVEEIPHAFVLDRQGIVRHADHPIRLRDQHVEPWL